MDHVRGVGAWGRAGELPGWLGMRQLVWSKLGDVVDVK